MTRHVPPDQHRGRWLFAALILVWSYHYRLFSRFDLEDLWTIVLNSVLLFLVLFYVYPLKFLMTMLIGPNGVMFGRRPRWLRN